MMTFANIERYLSDIRKEAKWASTLAVIAPGDLTPYLQKVMEAALCGLGVSLPGVKIIEAKGRGVHLGASGREISTHHLVALWNDEIFDIEGRTSWQEMEDHLKSNLVLKSIEEIQIKAMDRKALTRERMHEILSSTDSVRESLAQIVRKALATHIVAPILLDETPQANPSTGSRRSL